MSKCKRCGAPIFWAPTKNGKDMPVDEAPDRARGNLVLENGTVRVAAESDDDAFFRYTSHFATCPNANEFRKKRGSAK